MAVVFVAGPLSGLIVQPLIGTTLMHAFFNKRFLTPKILGVLADNCTSSFGRRRPYMLLGTLICILAMLLLGFTRPVASIFTKLGNHSVRQMARKTRSSSKITFWSERRSYHMACYPCYIFNRLFDQRR